MPIREIGHTPFITGEAINTEGYVVLSDIHPDGTDYHIWPSDEIIVLPGEATGATVEAFSDAGWVAGSIYFQDQGQQPVRRPFQWNALQGIQTLDTGSLGSDYGTLSAINDQGVAAGYVQDPSDPSFPRTPTNSFLWNRTEVSAIPLGLPIDLNNHGAVLYEDGTVYNGVHLVRLGTLPGSPRPLAMHLTDDWTAVAIVKQENEVIDPDEDINHHYHLIRYDPLDVAGDYNASGIVDQGDLDLVLLNWGGDALPDDWYHDFPDLPIDQAELDTVLLRWGRSDGTPVLPIEGAVPEPGTLSAILIALATTAIAPLASRRLSRRKRPIVLRLTTDH
jgi:hypothetical protein